MNEVYSGAQKRLVVPGDSIEADAGTVAGSGVMQNGVKYTATTVGSVQIRNGTVFVKPLNAAYIPRSGDLVIGVVVSMRSNLWMLDIGGPFEALLPMSLTPWNAQFGALEENMLVGDYALARVQEVDSQHGVVCTMKGMGLRKISTGVIETLSSHLAGQVIGKEGSTLQLLKNGSGCRMTLTQNGKLWVEGDDSDIAWVRGALEMISTTGHRTGLVERLQNYAQENLREV